MTRIGTTTRRSSWESLPAGRGEMPFPCYFISVLSRRVRTKKGTAISLVFAGMKSLQMLLALRQTGRRFLAKWARLLLWVPGLAIPSELAAVAPAAVECDLTSSITGACHLDGPGLTTSAATSSDLTMSWLGRHSLGTRGWYCGLGVQAENYFFTGGPIWPRRLQDYAALVSLEYFHEGEKVVALTARPGWYFETRQTSAAWDVPVDLAAGFPVTREIAGVLGFSNGRFYHHALPVFGFVWTISPRVRVEMVFPEPALLVTLGPAAELRFGGELVGGGFLSDPRPARTVVEYESYRVGAEWTRTWRSGFKIAVGAGLEAERSFDFIQQHQRLHGSGAGYLKLSATFAR